jgi:putative hydrolase of HD superfamily
VTSATTDAIVQLGRLSLMFGRVNRITYHEDGVTPESDTDHSVMLGLVACAFADAHVPDLDVGLVAQFALVHDLVEVYAGDTPTLRALSAVETADKQRREHDAYLRIFDEFAPLLPWLPARIAEYERRCTPQARFVKALDELLPKITHILNDLATIRGQGITPATLAARYDAQLDELREYATDFPPLFDLREDLIRRVMARLTVSPETHDHTTAAPEHIERLLLRN